MESHMTWEHVFCFLFVICLFASFSSLSVCMWLSTGPATIRQTKNNTSNHTNSLTNQNTQSTQFVVRVLATIGKQLQATQIMFNCCINNYIINRTYSGQAPQITHGAGMPFTMHKCIHVQRHCGKTAFAVWHKAVQRCITELHSPLSNSGFAHLCRRVLFSCVEEPFPHTGAAIQHTFTVWNSSCTQMASQHHHVLNLLSWLHIVLWKLM